jgi:hypothetical protein
MSALEMGAEASEDSWAGTGVAINEDAIATAAKKAVERVMICGKRLFICK